MPSGRLIQIKVWDEEQLDKAIDMEQIRVDPSPFQLVERTSLHKVTAPHYSIQCNPLYLYFTYLIYRSLLEKKKQNPSLCQLETHQMVQFHLTKIPTSRQTTKPPPAVILKLPGDVI